MEENNIHHEEDPSTPVTENPVKQKTWLSRYVAIPTVIGVGLIVYFTFFSEMSISRRIAYQHVIDSLEICLKAQQDSLEYYRDLNQRLTTDPLLMEQVVREQYNMKRQNEDVYVFN